MSAESREPPVRDRSRSAGSTEGGKPARLGGLRAYLAHESEEERRRRLREGAIILAAGAAVFVFALWEVRRPSANDGAAGNVFSFLLVNLNIVLVLVLVFLVVRNAMKLVIERRRRVPGSQLRSRMVLAFITIALFPAVVMLLISLEFSTNAIDGWFRGEVEESLGGAWSLSQRYYRNLADNASDHAAVLGRKLADVDAGDRKRLRAVASRYRREYGLAAVRIRARDGSVLVAVPSEAPGDATAAQNGVLPDGRALADVATAAGSSAHVLHRGDTDVVRAPAPIGGMDREPRRVVEVDIAVDSGARGAAERIVSAFREYRRLELNRQPFKNLYVLTMALASLVVVFSAIWLGLYLSRGITEPIGRLIGATRQVAEGNYDVRLPDIGGDEIGTLVESFTAMTADLKTSHETIEERRRYIENILANIDAGVVAVDVDGTITTVNVAAISLLGIVAGRAVGTPAADLFDHLGYGEVVQMLEELRRGAIGSGTKRNIVREAEGRTVLVIATVLARRGGGKIGYVLFFEDVSQLAGVQRMEAWREVARRIAHEIKNPLTPIQLSAQRLQRRLRDRLEPDDAQLLTECTETIVAEVEELRSLVNEFSQFARRSVVPKRRQDLNEVVEEALPLFRQAHPGLRIGFEKAESLPPIEMNRDAVKRALVNLLDNAVTAVAASPPPVNGDKAPPEPAVVVRTRLDSDLSRVALEVCDRGPGVPREFRERVFEPYFTTKTEGTGLGLAIVSSIAADHRAYLRLHDNPPRGSRFVLEFPVAGAQST